MKQIFPSLRRITKCLRRLKSNTSGVLMIEFAYSLPLVVGVVMSGSELTNYATSQMSVNQAALQIADNAARIGMKSLLVTRQVNEGDIDDVLVGAGLQFDKQGGLYRNGRIFLSSVEVDTVNSGKNKIAWQRCRGSKVATSSYGVQGATNLAGVGPAGRQIVAPTGSAIMFVEIKYDYQPFFLDGFLDVQPMSATAAMTVRGNRDYAGVATTSGVTASTCT